MALVRWSEELSVGVETLDDQHRHWLDLVNRLHDALLAGRADSELQSILAAVRDYTREHFAEEEGLMERHAFPGLEGHRRVHRFFLAQLPPDLGTGPAATKISLDLLRSMKDWLIDHIQRMDQAYARFLGPLLEREKALELNRVVDAHVQLAAVLGTKPDGEPTAH